MEKEIGFSRGRGGPSKSCFTLVEDVAPRDVEKKLVTQPEDRPRLVIFMMEKNKVEMMKIIGDEHVIDLDVKGVAEAILMLCITYFTFRLNFPRCLSQLMGLLQHCILKENFKGKKSTRFIEIISDVGVPKEGKASLTGGGEVKKETLPVRSEEYTDREESLVDYSGSDNESSVGNSDSDEQELIPKAKSLRRDSEMSKKVACDVIPKAQTRDVDRNSKCKNLGKVSNKKALSADKELGKEAEMNEKNLKRKRKPKRMVDV